MNERSDVVVRAMGYPYEAPWRPFAQLGHQTLEPGEVEVDREERVAMLAYGSNAAPEVLARKLALSDQPVLVVPAWLDGFDVVYSAHISPYGAIPATLQRSREAEVRVHLVYMTEAQVGLVSATEPNYEASTVAGALCRPDEGDPVFDPAAYLSRHGCLLVDGSEVALAAVEARGRAFAQMTEPEAIEHVRLATAPDTDTESFVLANVTDPELARRRSSSLDRRAHR